MYELEFDLDGFLDSMNQPKTARQRIEEHMEIRKLRAELSEEHEIEEKPGGFRPPSKSPLRPRS
jgi:hypothetical protein